MDILISSNLERLIYRIAGNDAEKNAELLKKYGLEGKFVVSYIGTVGMACGLEVVLERQVQVPVLVTALSLELGDGTVGVVVGQTDEVVPAVTLAGQFQAALLPDVVEGQGGYGSRVRDGALVHGIEGLQRIRVFVLSL